MTINSRINSLNLKNGYEVIRKTPIAPVKKELSIKVKKAKKGKKTKVICSLPPQNLRKRRFCERRFYCVKPTEVLSELKLGEIIRKYIKKNNFRIPQQEMRKRVGFFGFDAKPYKVTRYGLTN